MFNKKSSVWLIFLSIMLIKLWYINFYTVVKTIMHYILKTINNNLNKFVTKAWIFYESNASLLNSVFIYYKVKDIYNYNCKTKKF